MPTFHFGHHDDVAALRGLSEAGNAAWQHAVTQCARADGLELALMVANEKFALANERLALLQTRYDRLVCQLADLQDALAADVMRETA